ncbi:MAG: sigma-70 family RNA polymerase sigma factor, partial [Cyclobacteriaceae bacterium]|nr:sigma-70 family RNA polymerase sigma factor [Cyclobacteriaceae bacterium]
MFVGKESSGLSDAELIELFKSKSDPSALADLFVRYSALVYGVCLKYLKDRDDAKDAVMQIFEKLSQSLKDHEIEYFKSWLYSTTRNHCLM